MRDISELDVFSSIREPFRDFAREVCNRKKKILLISEPNIRGALTLAPSRPHFLIRAFLIVGDSQIKVQIQRHSCASLKTQVKEEPRIMGL